MNRLFTAACLFVLCFAAPAAVRAADQLRDIHGPQSAAGLPPFGTSAMVILMAVLLLATLAACRRRTPVPPVETPPRFDPDALQSLGDAYRRGEISVMQLCERLAALLRDRLTAADHQALTSAEVIAAARLTASADTIDRAAALLELCDRVRYGAALPERSTLLQACDQARQVLARLADE